MKINTKITILSIIYAVYPNIMLAENPPITLSSPRDIESPASTLLDTVVVSGQSQGPGLWQVNNGEKEMFILGTLSPLPSEIEWQTGNLRQLVSISQEVLWEPYYTVDVQTGFLRRLTLGYGMLKASKNPEGKTLRDVLPPDTYGRWIRMRDRYLPNERDIEKKRPVIAAEKLFEAAILVHGLSNRRIWAQPIRETTQTYGIKSTPLQVEVRIDANTAKELLKEAQNITLTDTNCLEATMDAIEEDLPHMITNANAWSNGEMKRINFSKIQRREHACADVLSNNEISLRYNIPNITQSIQRLFIQEAERALTRNQTTIAVVSLQNLVGPNGYASQLRAKGYEVIEP